MNPDVLARHQAGKHGILMWCLRHSTELGGYICKYTGELIFKDKLT